MIIKNNSLPEAQLKEMLLEMSKESSASFAAVTKCVIHWEYLGDRSKTGLLGDVIVGLAKIERERPDLRWDQTVGSTLAATLQADRNIATGSEDEIRMRRDRAEIARMVFKRLIEEAENPICFVGPLMGAMRDPEQMEAAKGLLELMDGKRLGKADAETMKLIGSVGTASMKDKTRREYVGQLLGRIIDEGECDLIYFVAPLLGAMHEVEGRETAKKLLERMEGKRLGAADADTMRAIISVGTANICKGDRQEYAKGLLRRVIDEGQCDLIHFVAPLLAAMKDVDNQEVAKELLGRMEGKRFGKADAETMKSIVSVGTASIVHEDQKPYVKKMLGAIIDEGQCDLIHFVVPLLAAMKDKRCAKDVMGLLDRMEGKRLGAADAETTRKIASITVLAMRNKNEWAHLRKVLGMLIDEGQCDLIRFVAPLLEDASAPDKARELLGKMGEKRLGKADAETIKEIASVAVFAIRTREGRPHVKKMLEKIIDEGQCDLIYLVAPLLTATQSEHYGNLAKSLLDRTEGKRLGQPDRNTLESIVKVIKTSRQGAVRSQYVEEFTERLKRELAKPQTNGPYEGPQWKPKNHEGDLQRGNGRKNLA